MSHSPLQPGTELDHLSLSYFSLRVLCELRGKSVFPLFGNLGHLVVLYRNRSVSPGDPHLRTDPGLLFEDFEVFCLAHGYEGVVVMNDGIGSGIEYHFTIRLFYGYDDQIELLAYVGFY